MELSDMQCALKLNEWLKEGERCRDTGEQAPTFHNKIQQAMHAYGWVKRDLQLGLAVYNAKYQKSQPDITLEIMKHWISTTEDKWSAESAYYRGRP